jgi:hypothetical protein
MGSHRCHCSLLCFLQWQGIHGTFQSEGTGIWDSSKALVVGGENPLPIFLSLSISHTHVMFSRLPRTSSWRHTRPFWRCRFCVRHRQRCYIVALWRVFLDREAHLFAHIEKQFKHGRHRRHRRGWRGSALPRYRNRLLPATAPSRGAGFRRSSGCRCISAAHG